MHSGLYALWGLFYFTGLGLYMRGSTTHRLPHAPIPFNGPRGWPWQHQDWFTPRGQRLRKIGLLCEAIGLVLLALSYVVQ